MNQLICAYLSHTHSWYEVGTLRVPTSCVYFVIFISLYSTIRRVKLSENVVVAVVPDGDCDRSIG